jgi:hypothetical protein
LLAAVSRTLTVVAISVHCFILIFPSVVRKFATPCRYEGVERAALSERFAMSVLLIKQAR